MLIIADSGIIAMGGSEKTEKRIFPPPLCFIKKTGMI